MPRGRVFISYAKADAKKAGKIAELLEERGVTCWIAPRDVKPGAAYGDEIIRGIETSSAFILVLSNASNESDFVAREVERAISKKKPVIPIRIAKVEPSRALQLFISGSQWVDVFSGKLATHMDRLAARFAEEATPEIEKVVPAAKAGSSSRLILGAGAALAVVIAAVAIVLAWPSSQPAPTAGKAQEADPSVIDNPVVLMPGVPQVADAPSVPTPGSGTAPAESGGAEPPIDIAKTPDDWSTQPPAADTAGAPADQGYGASEQPSESGSSGPSSYGQ